MILKDKLIEKKIADLMEKVDTLEGKIDLLLSEFGVETEVLEDEWRTVVRNGVETDYEVSNCGEVRNKRTDTMLNYHFNSSGKPRVNIAWIEGDEMKQTTILIEKLVAKAFLEPSIKNERIGHIDGDVKNNHVDNLYIKQ